MGETNGETVFLNDAAGVATFLLGSAASGPDDAPSHHDHLTGPALPGRGTTQDDIDALFD